MSDYMGKRVNMFLVLMIILVIIGMGGISIYYQRTFKDVNSGYESLSSSLESCTANFTQTSQQLIVARNSLNSTESDIRKYDTLYEQKASELENNKKQWLDTQTSLQKETVFKQQFQKQSEDLAKQVASLKSDVTTRDAQIAKLNVDMNKLRNCYESHTDAEEASKC